VTTTPPRKIAVLGGGAGALAAAFALTDTPELRARHRVTVYQMGWRLGGKGASGRNRRVADRIEEHGLHVWAGFYENAFALLRRCYDELARPAGSPLATVDEAFEKHSLIGLAEYVGGRWVPWYLDMAENSGVPGVGPEWPTARQYLEMVLDQMLGLALDPALFRHLGPAGPALRLASLAAGAAESLGLGGDDDDESERRPLQVRPLVLARRLFGALGGEGLERRALGAAVALVDGFMDVVRDAAREAFERDAGLRRAFVSLDLLATQLRGAVEDGALVDLDAIDGYDWLAWLRRHGASPLTVASPWVRGVYDYVFGFLGGDTSRPALSAAVAVRIQLLSLFAYKGAFFWKMLAGMGDAVFAPLYEVLRRRGVRFEFFHRVDSLHLAPDGRRVGRVRLTRQASLNEGLDEYAPLYDVGGLPCWPSEPLYGQLREGAELEARGVNLETNYSDWPGVGGVELALGADFDDVVFGIPLGSVPHLCGELLAASRAWREMVERVPTVGTQSMQLWLEPTVEGLGRRPAEPVITTGYAQPFDTWSDMSQVLARERWPAHAQPRSILYLCGPLLEQGPPPPFSDLDYPRRQAARVAANAATWLQGNVGPFWPKATLPFEPAGLDWSLLVDAREPPGVGERRLESQYVRANVDPAERYVLSVPGSARYRLDPGGSGFENLYLAGDWVRCYINAGCVEGAVIGGLLASRALCGYPARIRGEGGP
jgi:uncharacterized protein with NAD-binding domain and iron-sulfur cluster